MKLTPIILSALLLFANPEGVWLTLGELDFHVYYDAKLEDVIFEPKPTAEIKALEGQTITIKGFKSKYFSETLDKWLSAYNIDKV